MSRTFCDIASVSPVKHFRSRSGANSIRGADYLFKTRVECREFSVRFIELKIIGYQASVNTRQSRRSLHGKFFRHCVHVGNASTFFHKEIVDMLVLHSFDISNSAVL